MSLVRSQQLFLEPSFPLAVDRVAERTLFQPDLHRHEYFEMLYVEQGTLTNRLRSGEQTLKTGDLVVMKPFVLHKLDVPGAKAKTRATFCSFLPEIVDGSLHSLEEIERSRSPNRYYFRPMLALTSEDIPAVRWKIPSARRTQLFSLLAELRDHAHQKTDQGRAWARSSFLRLLAFLSDEVSPGQSQAGGDLSSELSLPASRYQQGLRKALVHIHAHYEQAIPLEEMAAMSGASVTYFCRLFKHETGLTFLQYVNGLRIERACVLLRSTSDNATEICYRVGFNDYSHFSRQFKRATGMSVSDFRQTDPKTS